jgi:hypothetical protein
MSNLPQLRESLMGVAERQVAREAPVWRRGPWGLAKRLPLGFALVVGLLVVAAAAYAATQLIQTGPPVRSEEGFSPSAGAGVAIPRSDGLLGIAAADPMGGPPWTMRVYDTSRGLGCVQVGRLVGGRIGVLGQDGAFGDDGRFHPLPVQVSQAEGGCVLLDGHGNAFLGVAKYGVPASGLPLACHFGSPAVGERCGRGDQRDVFYGLLGPDARSITYTLDGHLRTIPTVGKQGAYLIVEHTPVWIGGGGAGTSSAIPPGGGTLGGHPLPQPIRKVTYTSGRTCTIGQIQDSGSRGGRCLPPVGYEARPIRVPSQRELASSVRVRTSRARRAIGGSRGGEVAELLVSFVARVEVPSALSGYSVILEPPKSGRCRNGNLGQADASVGRDVRAGEHIQVTLTSGLANARGLFAGCPGIAHGRVIYSIPSDESFYIGPFVLPHRHSPIVTVGRFVYHSPGWL